MPIYKKSGRADGTWRVVVWRNNRPTERLFSGTRDQAKDFEENLRRKLSGVGPRRRRKFGPVDPEEQSGVSCVYFLRAGERGPIKIGVTRNLRKRMHQIQGGCAEDLTPLLLLPGGRCLEATFHAAFADERLSGEWFTPSKRLIGLISELALVTQEPNEVEESPSNDVDSDSTLGTCGQLALVALCRELEK